VAQNRDRAPRGLAHRLHSADQPTTSACTDHAPLGNGAPFTNGFPKRASYGDHCPTAHTNGHPIEHGSAPSNRDSHGQRNSITHPNRLRGKGG